MKGIVSQEKDGSTILMAEQFHYYTTTSTTQSGSRTVSQTKNHYRFDDIIICKVSSENEILWIQKLPKLQRGTDSYADLSFSYQEMDNNHYLIFLDNVKNIDLAMNETPAAHVSGKWGYLTYYKVLDDSGDVSKQSVFTTRETPVKGQSKPYLLYFFSPYEVIKTSENTFMMEFYKKDKEDVMIKVNVE